MNYLRWPLEKIEIIQKFGEDFINAKTGKYYYQSMGLKGHDGIDFRTRYFTIGGIMGRGKCLAARDGKIETIRYDKGGYGTHIRIRHEDGSLTIYGHLSKIDVEVGQIVVEGQAIGITGNTGASTGPHLHFEYRPKNADANNGYAGAVDPLPLLYNYQTMLDEKNAQDTAVNAEQHDAYAFLSENKIMSGINPDGPLLRREAALIIYRLAQWVLKLINR